MVAPVIVFNTNNSKADIFEILGCKLYKDCLDKDLLCLHIYLYCFIICVSFSMLL